MHKIPSYEELRMMADAHAMEISVAFHNDGAGEREADRVFAEFQEKYQPRLTDKPFTAIFRTYQRLLLNSLNNILKQESTPPPPPVKVSSIGDNEIIQRQNRLSPNEEIWSDYAEAAVNLADKLALEMASAIRAGADTSSLLIAHNLQFAKLSFDYGFTEDEVSRDEKIFSRQYEGKLKEEMERHISAARATRALPIEAELMLRKTKNPGVSRSAAGVSVPIDGEFILIPNGLYEDVSALINDGKALLASSKLRAGLPELDMPTARNIVNSIYEFQRALGERE